MRWIYLILLVSIIPLASSISTTMFPVYQPGETMIIEIQGNILEPIERTDVVFRRAHVAIAVDYDVKRISGKYYLYAQLPVSKNNYTLYLNNIATTVNGQLQTIDYNQTFQVDGNLTEYSVSPGFIVTSQDFSLVLKSNMDQETIININFPQESAVTLQPGTNTIQFLVGSVAPGFYSAQVGKYTVPIQITSSQQSNMSQKASLEVYPKIIRETIEKGVQKSYGITITNTGQGIGEIYFIYNNEIFSLSKETISIGSNASENLTITLKRLDSQILETILLATGSEELGNITLDISFTSNQSEVTNSSRPEYYCSELGGKFCAAAEVCSAQTVQSLDGTCCVGTCNPQEESSSSWIFYVLIVVLLIILFIIYSRYKKTRLPKPKGLPINSILKKPI